MTVYGKMRIMLQKLDSVVYLRCMFDIVAAKVLYCTGGTIFMLYLTVQV